MEAKQEVKDQKQEWKNKRPTKKQTYALYCSSGIDVRPIDRLTRGQLSDLIEKSNNEGISKEKRKDLISKGAVERREKGLNQNGKKSYSKIFNIVKEAVRKGKEAGEEKLKELEEEGSKIAVVGGDPTLSKDGIGLKNKKKVGEMLDLCGFSSIVNIRGNSRLINAIKQEGNKRNGKKCWDITKDAYISKGRKGYSLNISTKQQEISVNETTHKRALEGLENHDFKGLKEAYVSRHID